MVRITTENTRRIIAITKPWPYMEEELKRERIVVDTVAKDPFLLRKEGTVKDERLLEKTRSTVDMRAGMTIGSVTFLKILNLEAFNTVAASSRLASMFLNIPPMRRYAKGA